MNIETIKFLKAITDAFGQDDAVQFEQATWEKIHAGIKEAIAELESQEPVAWVDPTTLHHLKIGLEGVHLVYETEMVNSLPLYDKPQRTWAGLTDEEVELYWDWEDFQCGCGPSTLFAMVRDIEARLKDRNT
jgi:hypothetical protein